MHLQPLRELLNVTIATSPLILAPTVLSQCDPNVLSLYVTIAWKAALSCSYDISLEDSQKGGWLTAVHFVLRCLSTSMGPAVCLSAICSAAALIVTSLKLTPSSPSDLCSQRYSMSTAISASFQFTFSCSADVAMRRTMSWVIDNSNSQSTVHETLQLSMSKLRRNLIHEISGEQFGIDNKATCIFKLRPHRHLRLTPHAPQILPVHRIRTTVQEEQKQPLCAASPVMFWALLNIIWKERG